MVKRRRKPSEPVVSSRKSRLEIRQLRAFLALIEHEQTTAAAQALGLAQSTVSESILALERALGTPVFRRGRDNKTHEARLTDAGRALVPHAREVLAGVERAHAAVAAATTSALASVLIVANESVSTYLLPAATARVRNRWPNAQLSITIATCTSARSGVTDGTFDVGVMLDFAASAQVTTSANFGAVNRRVLAPIVPLVAFARTSHPLASKMQGAGITREQLAPYPVFVTDAAGEFHALLTRALIDESAVAPQMQSTGSVEAVKKAVDDRSTGIGILPAYAIVDELRAGTFAAIHLRPALPTVRVEAWTAPGRESHPVLRDLLDALADACQQSGAERPLAVGFVNRR